MYTGRYLLPRAMVKFNYVFSLSISILLKRASATRSKLKGRRLHIQICILHDVAFICLILYMCTFVCARANLYMLLLLLLLQCYFIYYNFSVIKTVRESYFHLNKTVTRKLRNNVALEMSPFNNALKEIYS